MSALVLAAVRRARAQRAQVGLEGIMVFSLWLVVSTLFVNLLFFLGTAMLVQSNVNRAAMQAAALGCVDPAVAVQLQNRRGLGMTSVDVVARTPPGDPPPAGSDNGYYQFSKASVVDTDGRPSGGSDAFCAAGTGDTVGSGRFIYVQVTYEQNLWILEGVFRARGARRCGDNPAATRPCIRRSALVISHALEGQQ